MCRTLKYSINDVKYTTLSVKDHVINLNYELCTHINYASDGKLIHVESFSMHIAFINGVDDGQLLYMTVK